MPFSLPVNWVGIGVASLPSDQGLFWIIATTAHPPVATIGAVERVLFSSVSPSDCGPRNLKGYATAEILKPVCCFGYIRLEVGD